MVPHFSPKEPAERGRSKRRIFFPLRNGPTRSYSLPSWRAATAAAGEPLKSKVARAVCFRPPSNRPY